MHNFQGLNSYVGTSVSNTYIKKVRISTYPQKRITNKRWNDYFITYAPPQLILIIHVFQSISLRIASISAIEFAPSILSLNKSIAVFRPSCLMLFFAVVAAFFFVILNPVNLDMIFFLAVIVSRCLAATSCFARSLPCAANV